MKDLQIMSYVSAYDGDKSVYEDEHVLDNIGLMKNLMYLKKLDLYNLKILKICFPM